MAKGRTSEGLVSEAQRATLRARSEIARALGDRLEDLASQDGRKRAAELAFFLCLCACGVLLTVTGWSASRWIPTAAGIAATALALNGFVLLMHDGMHDSLFRSRARNRLVSVLLGSTFLMSYSAYRVLHARHHAYLGDPRDPDDYQNYTQRPALLWSLHFVRLLCGSLLYVALIPLLALRYGSHRDRRRILAEYVFLFLVYGAAVRFLPLPLLLVAWLIPLLIVGSLTSIRGFTQHGVTDASDPYLASRTVLPHPIVEFFVLHENYHLEHHLFPEVPSYHLRELHRLAWPVMPRVVSGRGYLQFLLRFLRATSRRDTTPIGLTRPTARSA